MSQEVTNLFYIFESVSFTKIIEEFEVTFYKVTVLLYSFRYFKKKAKINFLSFISLL